MNTFEEILCLVATAEECKPALEHAVAVAENNQAKPSVAEVDIVDAWRGVGDSLLKS